MVSRNIQDVVIAGIGATVGVAVANFVHGAATERMEAPPAWAGPAIYIGTALVAMFIPASGILGDFLTGAAVGCMGTGLLSAFSQLTAE